MFQVFACTLAAEGLWAERPCVGWHLVTQASGIYLKRLYSVLICLVGQNIYCCGLVSRGDASQLLKLPTETQAGLPMLDRYSALL